MYPSFLTACHRLSITCHRFLVDRLNGLKTDTPVKLDSGIVIGGDMQDSFADTILLEPEQCLADKCLAKAPVPKTRQNGDVLNSAHFRRVFQALDGRTVLPHS